MLDYARQPNGWREDQLAMLVSIEEDNFINEIKQYTRTIVSQINSDHTSDITTGTKCPSGKLMLHEWKKRSYAVCQDPEWKEKANISY